MADDSSKFKPAPPKITRVLMAVERETDGLPAVCMPDEDGVAVLVLWDHPHVKEVREKLGKGWIEALTKEALTAGNTKGDTQLLRQYLAVKGLPDEMASIIDGMLGETNDEEEG